MLYPDNFFYFISLFSVSFFLGTYLLLSYNRNHLIILNALIFYMVAIRACTEFYLPQIEDYQTVIRLAVFHSILMYVWAMVQWYIVWFYIRPFKNWKWEKQINQGYFWGIVILPSLFFLYHLYERTIYTIPPTKIDGYWRFITNTDLWATQMYSLYAFQFIQVLIIGLFLLTIFRNKRQRLQKIVVLLFWLVVLPILTGQVVYQSTNQYQIPNFAFTYLAFSIVLSWFITEYRLFRDGFDDAKKDLLNSISDFAVTTGLDFTITHANEKARQLFSIKNELPITQVLTNFSQLTAQKMEESLQKLLHHSENELELILDIPAVGEKIFSLKAAPFKKGNQQIGHTFLLKDLTLIRQKEKELEAANAAKDRLFAIIGHDLRKPALAFRGITKKVKYLIRKEDFETLFKYGASLEKAAFSLNSLLTNLLNWALQQRNVLPYDPVPVDVEAAAREIYDLFDQMAADKGIELEVNIARDTVAFADLNAFTTVVRNLLDNAIKYTPVGGHITLTSEKLAEGVILRIADTGIGMNKAQIDKLFDLDAQKSQAGTDGELGTGLGLSLVRDLVQLNKGKISVESKWNQGTTFEVILPVEN